MILKLTKNKQLKEDSIIIYYRNINHKIQKIIDIVEEQIPFILGKKRGTSYQIDVNDVFYFESVDKTVFIYTKGDIYENKSTLKNIEDELSGFHFIRISKSMIINIYQLKSIQSDVRMRLLLTLKNNEKLVATRHYRKSIYEHIEQLGGNKK